MSCYGWEKGSFIIPTNQWADLKKSLRTAYNKAVEADLATMEKVLAKVKADHKGKRNVDWVEALRKELMATDERRVSYGYGPGYTDRRDRYEFKIFEEYELERKLLVQKPSTVAGAPAKIALASLKKKDFPLATSKTVSFSHEECSIHFDDTKRTVHWRVSENNHAVERARESLIGSTLFSLLSKVQWGRGSGGTVVGNDEYNRDDDSPGGGANELKESFGPIGMAAADEKYKLSRGRRKSSRVGSR